MLTIWTSWPVRGAWIIIPPPRYMATWWIELELLADPLGEMYGSKVL